MSVWLVSTGQDDRYWPCAWIGLAGMWLGRRILPIPLSARWTLVFVVWRCSRSVFHIVYRRKREYCFEHFFLVIVRVVYEQVFKTCSSTTLCPQLSLKFIKVWLRLICRCLPHQMFLSSLTTWRVLVNFISTIMTNSVTQSRHLVNVTGLNDFSVSFYPLRETKA